MRKEGGKKKRNYEFFKVEENMIHVTLINECGKPTYLAIIKHSSYLFQRSAIRSLL